MGSGVLPMSLSPATGDTDSTEARAAPCEAGRGCVDGDGTGDTC